MPFLGQLPIIGQLFRSDAFRAKKSDLVIFVTPVISDPELTPNANLLARADRIDQKYRNEYGNPEPLVDDEEKATRTIAPRQPIAPTPATSPAPLRSAPVREETQAPISEQFSPEAPLAKNVVASAPRSSPVTAQPAAESVPASTPPDGVAEALRMLSAAPHSPVATGATDAPTGSTNASPPLSNGKVLLQQVGVLGNPAN
jgi:pilus assembly protein CpaC